MGEAERGVEPDRRQCLAAADHGDHLAIAQFGRALDHPGEQRTADAAPDLAGIDIDRILKRKAIADTRPVWSGIAIPDDLSAIWSIAAFGNDIRKTARHQLGSAPRHFFDARRDFLKTGDAVENVMTVNCCDRHDVVIARRAYRELAGAHPAANRRSPA